MSNVVCSIFNEEIFRLLTSIVLNKARNYLDQIGVYGIYDTVHVILKLATGLLLIILIELSDKILFVSSGLLILLDFEWRKV